MSEQENIALVKKLYDAFARGDTKTILDHVTDDVKWSSPGPGTVPYSGDRTGPAQVREFFNTLASTQENVKLTIDRFVAQGDAMPGRRRNLRESGSRSSERATVIERYVPGAR
jgi:ketosteroid isomerase-like protein